jgi:hypothetical protein
MPVQVAAGLPLCPFARRPVSNEPVRASDGCCVLGLCPSQLSPPLYCARAVKASDARTEDSSHSVGSASFARTVRRNAAASTPVAFVLPLLRNMRSSVTKGWKLSMTPRRDPAMTSIHSLPATGAALRATWRTRSAATATRVCDPEPFYLRVASLHGSHDECASIKRPLSNLPDIRVRICSDLSRNVLIDDRFVRRLSRSRRQVSY